MKLIFTLGLGVICAIGSLQAQTTYTWNNGSPLFGGSGDFQTPTNWVPTRTTPASNDILIFNQGGFIDVSNVPNQTIGAMYLNGVGGVRLTGANTDGILTINYLQLDQEVSIQTVGGANFGLSIKDLNATISGKRLSYNTGIKVTFTGNVFDNGIDFFGNWNNTNRFFSSSSIYTIVANNSVGATNSTWLSGSTYSITGITNSGFPQPFSDNGYTPFSNFVWDCPNQNSNSNLTTYNSTTITVNGNFIVKNTGSGRISFNTPSALYFNNFTQESGDVSFNNKTPQFTGNLIQNGGQMRTQAANLIMAGTNNQQLKLTNIIPDSWYGNLNISNSGTAPNNIVSMVGTGGLINTLNLNSGRLAFNQYVLSVNGTINATSGSLLGGNTLGGLYLYENPGGTLTIPAIENGIGYLGMNRQFGGANPVTFASNTTILVRLEVLGDNLLNVGAITLELNGVFFYNSSQNINTIGSNIMFKNNSTYIHARDGGNIPTATWQDGSTCSISGITTNGVGNTNQNFFNFHWNCPSQTGGIDLVGNGNTMTVRNDFINFNTGSARLNHSNNNPTFLNTNNFILNGGNFCGNFGGAQLNVNGNFGVLTPSIITNDNGGNLNISFVGANTNITITGTLNSPDQTNFILAKSIVGARLTMFSNLSFPQEFQIQNGIIDLNGFSFSTTNRFPAPNTNYTSGFVSTNPNSSLTYRTSGTGGTTTYTILGVNGIYRTLLIDNDDDETRVFSGNTTILSSLNVQNGCCANFNINGINSIYLNTLLNATGFARSTSNTANNLTFGPLGIYIHDIDGSSIPTATWQDGSTCSITGITGNLPGNGTQNFSNFSWNCPSQTANCCGISDGATFISRQNFIVQNTGSQQLRFGNAGGGTTILLNNVSILGGTLFNAPFTNTNTSITGNLHLASGGSWDLKDANLRFVGGNSTLFNQGSFLPSGSFSAAINKNNISDAIILTSDVNLPFDFSFQNGLIQTNNFVFSTTGNLLSTSQTTGWVNGNLAKNLPVAASTTRLYEIGTASVYAPASLTASSVNTQGDIVASVVDETASPAFSSTCLSNTNNVNLVWNINTVTGNVVAPINIVGNFTFSGASSDIGYVPPSTSIFLVNGSSSVPLSALATSTTFSVSGINNWGSIVSSSSSTSITGSWKGLTSSDWFDANNWCGGSAPTSVDDITVSNAVFMPIITTTSASVNSITVNAGAYLSITGTSANAIDVNQNIVNNGTFGGIGAIINLLATANMSVSGSGVMSAFRLRISNTGIKEILAPISITGLLKLDAGNTTLNSNGNISLLSTSLTTAKIGVIPSTSSILGIVNVQRFVPSKIVRRNISSPVSNADFDQLKRTMRLTGSGTGFEAPSFIPSVLMYDETNTAVGINVGKLQPTNSTDLLQVGRGYEVLIKDRNVNPAETRPNQPSSPLLLSFSGIVNQGDINLPVSYTNTSTITADGWNLVGNPYPSEIDWDNGGWTKTNISNAVYLFDPGTSLTSTTTARGQYYTYSGGSCVPAVAGCNSLIAMSQGFYVKATGANPVLSINENAKTDAMHRANFRTEILEDKIGIVVDGNGFMDETLFKLDSNSTNAFSSESDLFKFSNPTLNLSSKSDEGYNLVINKVGLLSQEVEFPIEFTSSQNGIYSFTANKSIVNQPVDVFLKDKLLNSIEPISGTESYSFTHNTTNSGARFSVVFRKGEIEETTKIEENVEKILSVFPNPVTNGILYINLKSKNTENVNFDLIGLSDGRIIHTEAISIGGQNSTYEFNLNQLSISSGVYLLRARNQSMNQIFKIIIY